MPTNRFFNFYKNKPEQNLVEDLLNESINMFGFNAYYIPNSNTEAKDFLYGDDPLKKFDDAYLISAYLSNSVDPGVNNDFFSKFGLEIKNNVRVQVARREFAKQVPQDTHTRPKEGDLFYIPFLSGTGELYEIKFVNDAVDFFTLGRKEPYYWELELELFKYSHEEIDTGISEIDFPNKMDAYAIDYQLGIGSGDYRLGEFVYQGASSSNPDAIGKVQEWDLPSKIIKLTNISGIFSNTSPIIGQTSNTSYYISTYDPMKYAQKENAWDNKNIEIELNDFIDSSESNPFGIL
nr:MAG: hypothetical protein [Caudoviricetes sp.]